MPRAERLAFAETFLEERTYAHSQSRLETAVRSKLPSSHRSRVAVAAQVALLVLDLTENSALQDETVVDLLRGAARADDLTITPEPAVDRSRTAVATVRFDKALEDESNPHAVAVKEVLARAAFATVECRSKAQTLGFLLQADGILRHPSLT